ncbi:MAG: hypothetical protein J6D42_03845 [Clostridia bacterium]|nr:hypothetical protein [Clostridia bacterium]
MEFIWLIAGIIYIIYKGFKEESETTKNVFKVLGFISLVFILPWLIFYGIAGEVFSGILLIIYLFIFGIVAFLIYHFKRVAELEEFESMMKDDDDKATYEENNHE